jgi:hypothetical protein
MNTHVIIHPFNRPVVFELLTELYYAMGVVNRDQPERTVFAIPARFSPYLDDIEARVEHLTNNEIQTFVDGEDTEMRSIAGRSFGLTKAHELLEAMFEGEGSL